MTGWGLSSGGSFCVCRLEIRLEIDFMKKKQEAEFLPNPLFSFGGVDGT